MPIQSTPVTTQSTINLSDINIDTDLNLGSNTITGFPTATNLTNLINGTYFKYLTYDKTIIPVNYELFDDTTGYSTTSNSYSTKVTYTLNSTLNENLTDKFKYILKDVISTSTETPGYVTYAFRTADYFKLHVPNSTYRIKVTDAEYYHNSTFSYNQTLALQIKSAMAGTNFAISRYKSTVVGKIPLTPFTSDNIDIDNLIGIFMPASSKITLNAGEDIITAGADLYLMKDNYHLRDNTADYTNYTAPVLYISDIGSASATNYSKQLSLPETVTQIDIITGNPTFIFKS